MRTLILSLLGVAACSGAVQPDGRAVRGTVVLSRSVAQASTPIAGTFRSVVDSVALSVTAGGTTRTLGHHFAPNEISVSIPITLPAGIATVSAEVLSNNKALLFSGSASPNIDGDGFSVDVPLTALTSVLVVFPDTLKIDSTNAQLGLRIASATVRNSGNTVLAWSVVRVSTNTTSVCSFGCSVTPDTGHLAPNVEMKIRFTMPSSNDGGPFPAGTLSYLFSSREGTVTLPWRYPAAP